MRMDKNTATELSYPHDPIQMKLIAVVSEGGVLIQNIDTPDFSNLGRTISDRRNALPRKRNYAILFVCFSRFLVLPEGKCLRTTFPEMFRDVHDWLNLKVPSEFFPHSTF